MNTLRVTFGIYPTLFRSVVCLLSKFHEIHCYPANKPTLRQTNRHTAAKIVYTVSRSTTYLHVHCASKTSPCSHDCILGRLLRVDLIQSVSNVRPSTKRFFNSNEIWYVGRGRWVMHDGMQYDPIQGQGQGHEPLKVGNPIIFKGYLLPHL